MPHIFECKKFWQSPHNRTLPQDFCKRTLLMGIVNATPDSFSDGGKFLIPRAAAEHAKTLIADGADIIDLGAESTRPGARKITPDEEWQRLSPALSAIRENLPDVPVSIDTSNAEVAEKAVAAGADILNDVCAIGERCTTAGTPYPLGTIAARTGTPLIAMHNRFTNPNYRNFWTDFLDDLQAGIERILNCGVPAEQLWIDPGFGFGKTPEQNLEIVARLREIAELGFPVLLGTSRKSTLGIVLGGKPPEARTGGDSACAALGAFHGAACLRLHDIAAHKDVVAVADAVFRNAPAQASFPKHA